MTKRRLPARTAERVIRNAYDLEDLANRLLADGHEGHANSIRHISSQLGKVGRAMLDDAEQQVA